MGKGRFCSLMFIGGILSVSAPALSAQDSGLTPDTIVGAEIQRRMNMLSDFDAKMKQASDLRRQNAFEDADAIYRNDIPPILNQLGDYAKEQRESLRLAQEVLAQTWGDFEYDQAEDAIARKDYTSAIAHLHKSEEKCPSPRVTTRLNWCESIVKDKKFTEDTQLNSIDPENEGRKYNIATLRGTAKQLFKNGKYAEAKDYCEKVFLQDPYDAEATNLLGKIYERINSAARQRTYADNIERIAEVVWKWQVNIPIKDATVEVAKGGAGQADGFRSEMYEKLETIIFPSVDYDGVSIRDVISTLIDDSKLYDPRKKGILINHNLSSEVDADGNSVKQYPKITLQLNNVPLGEIIRYVCQAANLRYQVTNNTVFIGEVVEDMEQQTFAIETAAVLRIAEKNGSEGGEGADAGAPEWDTNAGGGASAGATKNHGYTDALKSYFSERGVAFPEGSTISYATRSGKMYVKNTPTNLRRIADLLSGMGDLEATMVLIESKFIEVAQHDLEQLGFHWSLTKTLKNPADPNNPGVGDMVPGESTNSLPRADDILYSSRDMDQLQFEQGTIFSSTIIPNAGSNRDINLNLTITALSQKDLTESLAAPKITATHGKEAVLRMVKQEYYPTSWTQPEIRSTSVGVTLMPAIPEFSGPKDIGITLKVTPQVAPSKNTIELELEPSISEFESWEEYSYFITVPGSSVPTEQTIKMPRITYREFRSKIRVYNGETIVLGGVLRDQSTVYDYKYPFLGDLPIVGRLFRDYKNESTKTNLLIFITARIITGDGMPSKPLENIGKHDYNR